MQIELLETMMPSWFELFVAAAAMAICYVLQRRVVDLESKLLQEKKLQKPIDIITAPEEDTGADDKPHAIDGSSKPKASPVAPGDSAASDPSGDLKPSWPRLSLPTDDLKVRTRVQMCILSIFFAQYSSLSTCQIRK